MAARKRQGTASTRKPAKAREGLLVDMARTIGSTLGTLAAKTRTVKGTVTKFPGRSARAQKSRRKSAKPRTRRKA